MRDVIIIGGGPGGLASARSLASEGFDVVVYEEHESSGDPVHCTGVLAADAFDDLGVPREVILNELRTARFYAPCGASIEHTTASIEAVVIDRLALDRALFRAATNAGVEVVLGRRVIAVDVQSRWCVGDAWRRRRGSRPRLRARLWCAVCDPAAARPRHAGRLSAIGADRGSRACARRCRSALRTCGRSRRIRLDGSGQAAIRSARPCRSDVRS